jgi:hypothetical protein
MRHTKIGINLDRLFKPAHGGYFIIQPFGNRVIIGGQRRRITKCYSQPLIVTHHMILFALALPTHFSMTRAPNI